MNLKPSNDYYCGLGLALSLCLGCGTATPTVNPTPSPSSAQSQPVDMPISVAADSPRNATSDATPLDGEGIQVRDMNWPQLQALIAEHKGKVVVVDVWSTACEPCLREFPHLVELQQRHGDDLVGISFDCDFIGAKNKPVDYYRERVVRTLTEMKADKIINVMSSVASDELFLEMDLDSIPAVYVFDREGKLSKRFDNRTPAGGDEEGISYQTQINPLVAELVQAAKP